MVEDMIGDQGEEMAAQQPEDEPTDGAWLVSGVAHVGYVPGDRVVGLSKMARLVSCFARRLQVQERLTNEVAEAMQAHLQPEGVGVIVTAHHSCMSCRGVRQPTSSMVTSAMLGSMREARCRAEFLELIGP